MVRKHGEKKASMLMGPEVPITKQIDEIKALKRSGRSHKEYESVTVYQHKIEIRFDSPKKATDRAKFLAEQDAAVKAKEQTPKTK
jgi:hypothetical protein